MCECKTQCIIANLLTYTFPGCVESRFLKTIILTLFISYQEFVPKAKIILQILSLVERHHNEGDIQDMD